MKHLLCTLIVLLPLFARAQQDEYYQKKNSQPANPRQYSIVLKDGTQLRGELIRQDSSEAIIRTRNLGEVRVSADQIVRMELVGAQAEGEVYPNLFSQTMRLAPTAFSAEKGRLFFRNYGLSISQFEYGISDNWSVGTTFLTLLPTNLFSLNTKVSLPVSNRLRLGVSAQYIAARFDKSLGGIGYLQGLVTTGDHQNNTTFGLGWSVSDGKLSQNVIGTFGLVRKVSPKLTFITENFVLIGSGSVDFVGMVSAGIRFDRQRHAFDLAAYVPFVIGNVSTPLLLLPFGSYHLRIGR